MTWTGPGHQELVSFLAVKNETLRQINLCEDIDTRTLEIVKKSLLMPTQSLQIRLNLSQKMSPS
ncbi:hypothetical protein SynWH8103_01365 [Synechococcus sp. WH 8103]|nr:hypothetical protein SynWH8103_01365 [Synechococcus sp. WH 8103]